MGTGEKGRRAVSGGSSSQAKRGQGGSAPANCGRSDVLNESVSASGPAGRRKGAACRAEATAGAARLDLSKEHLRTQTLEALGQMRLPGLD